MKVLLKKSAMRLLGRYPAFSGRSLSFQLTVLCLLLAVFFIAAGCLWQLSLQPAQHEIENATSLINTTK